MKLLLLFIFAYLSCTTENTLAQIEILENIRITFNATGINYPQDILFFLYTRRNPKTPQQLLVNNSQLLNESFFNCRNPTKFITHGWTTNGTSPSCILVKDAFLEVGDYNVIIVDWNTTASGSYLNAASHVKSVGKYVATMIEFVEKQKTSLKSMTLVGHSLGSHVMGIAGNFLRRPVAHIVGLDPARPGFRFNSQGGRLHYRDASQVEVIHTDAGHLGYSDSLGDIDYYPNSGTSQPGCGIDLDHSCSHGRAYRYYAEALMNSKAWYAVLCDSYDDFLEGKCDNNPIDSFPGQFASFSKRKGNYMLRTESVPPFGLGMNGTRSNKSTNSSISFL